MKVSLHLKKSTYSKQINCKAKSQSILDGMVKKLDGKLILKLVLQLLLTQDLSIKNLRTFQKEMNTT